MLTSLKNNLSDLAIFGGRIAFPEPLHVGAPNIADEEALIGLVRGALSRKWLTNGGPLVTELETQIARYLGVRHCIVTCNGTIALEMAIKALGLRGEVIIPAFTFVATAHALQWQEITPVFCDISPSTHTIDPLQVERLITPRTTGIIGVHVWGAACDVHALQEIAKARRLQLLYDAAHAFGCEVGGQKIGSFGRAEIFSFHATKFFNTAEGGAITTNEDDLASRLRLMRNFGFIGYDQVVHIGTNGKMTELCAAVGLSNLPHLPRIIDHNRRNHELYSTLLKDIPGIRLYHPRQDKWNYQYVVLEIDENVHGLSRNGLIETLRRDGILARRYFYPGCHQMEPYRSYFPHAGLLLPETEALCERLLILPTGLQVKARDIEVVSSIIRTCLANPKPRPGRTSIAGCRKVRVSRLRRLREALSESERDHDHIQPPVLH